MNKYRGFSKMWFLVLLLVAFVAGCGGNHTEYAKSFTAYSLNGVSGTIDEPAKAIVVTLPFGTNVTALVATFTTTGASVNVGTVAQTSATTPNNFATPVTYTVTAADGTTAAFTVTVTIAPNSAKAITAFSLAGAAGIVNEGTTAKVIAVTVPYGTNLTNLVATFTTTGAGVKVGTTVQASGTTGNNFTAPVTYTVTAADGSSVPYAVNVTIAQNPAKTISAFSFVGFTGFVGTVNEAAKTIAVNLPFGTDVRNLAAAFTTTGTGVKVGSAVQTSGTTLNDFTGPVTYTVTAADGSSVTYAVNVTIAPNPAKAFTSFSFAGFTGAAGTVNESAKTIAVTVPYGTNLTNLVATFTTTGVGVKVGTAVQTSAATANNFTTPVAYIVTAADTTTATYSVSVTIAPNPAKAITAFSFAGFTGAAGTVNDAAKTIVVTVPFGTGVTALVATFATNGANVKVGTAVQTSGATANNFTTPVAYIVTAADNTTATFTVTVTIAKNPAKAISAYSFVGFTGFAGTINEAAKTIAVTLPNGTILTNLTAAFSTTGTGVTIGTAVQTSGTTLNSFTNPVVYTVTAADGSTANYTVTVTVASNAAKAITAYSVLGVTGIINEAAKTIAVTMPMGTNLTALAATFTITGKSVTVGLALVPQISGTTPNDFTNSVTYRVTAADNSFVDYLVTVTVSTAIANPTAPNLGETARFVILASQAVTTTGTTAISNGDIGIIDLARTYFAGFTTGAGPGQYNELTNGLSYAHDDMPPFLIPSPYASTIAFINQVRTDLGNANSFLAADPNPGAATQVCPIELGTLVLTRGVYKTSADVGITTGPLTLDAQGDPNAVFIFSIDGTFTTGASGSIVLKNGALAKNVYFRTAGVTTIAAGTIFYGNVFAATQVNVLAGANVTGRLFAVTDRVTLIADTVTKAP
jgi:hypothetical protein